MAQGRWPPPLLSASVRPLTTNWATATEPGQPGAMTGHEILVPSLGRLCVRAIRRGLLAKEARVGDGEHHHAAGQQRGELRPDDQEALAEGERPWHGPVHLLGEHHLPFVACRAKLRSPCPPETRSTVRLVLSAILGRP